MKTAVNRKVRRATETAGVTFVSPSSGRPGATGTKEDRPKDRGYRSQGACVQLVCPEGRREGRSWVGTAWRWCACSQGAMISFQLLVSKEV